MQLFLVKDERGKQMKPVLLTFSFLMLILSVPLPAEEHIEADVIAVILSVEGEVRIEPNSQPSEKRGAPTNDWKIAHDGNPVFRGERLSTLENGIVRLVVKPNENWEAVRIGPNRLWKYQDDNSNIKTGKSFLVESRNAVTFRAALEARTTSDSCMLGPVLPEFSALAGYVFTADWSNLAASQGPYRVLVKNESGQAIVDHLTTETDALIEFPKDNAASYSWTVRSKAGQSLHTGRILVRSASEVRALREEYYDMKVKDDFQDELKTVIQALVLLEHKLYLQAMELLLSARSDEILVDESGSESLYDNWISKVYRKMCQPPAD